MKKNKTELEHLRDAETGDAYYWQINLVTAIIGALIALVGIIGFACGIILVLTHSSTSLQDKIIACLIFGGGIVFMISVSIDKFKRVIKQYRREHRSK